MTSARSIARGIFYHSQEQKRAAEEVMADIDSRQLYRHPLVTTLELLRRSISPRICRQECFARNPNQGYCQVIVAPRVAKIPEAFSSSA